MAWVLEFRGTCGAAHLAVPDRDDGVPARLENRARRVLPAGLGAGAIDPEVDLDGGRHRPSVARALPDTYTPESAFTARQSVRLAVVTAMQSSPPVSARY